MTSIRRARQLNLRWMRHTARLIKLNACFTQASRGDERAYSIQVRALYGARRHRGRKP